MSVKKLSFLLVSFFWLNITFAEYPSNLQGEWVRNCTKVGSFYFTNKLAVFRNNIMVHSWKWYNDSNCKTQMQGEYWDKWKIKADGPSSGPGIIQLKYTLIDGHKNQCSIEFDILQKKRAKLYFGNRYSGTKKQLPCGKRPTELDKSFFTFSRHLTQTAEEYIKPLDRIFKN